MWATQDRPSVLFQVGAVGERCQEIVKQFLSLFHERGPRARLLTDVVVGVLTGREFGDAQFHCVGLLEHGRGGLLRVPTLKHSP